MSGGRGEGGERGCLYNFSTGGIAMPGHSRCYNPVAVDLIAGCMHEHGGPLPMCSEHVTSVVAKLERGAMECDACRRIDGHSCSARLSAVRERETTR